MQPVCIYNISLRNNSPRAYGDAWDFSGGTVEDPISDPCFSLRRFLGVAASATILEVNDRVDVSRIQDAVEQKIIFWGMSEDNKLTVLVPDAPHLTRLVPSA